MKNIPFVLILAAGASLAGCSGGSSPGGFNGTYNGPVPQPQPTVSAPATTSPAGTVLATATINGGPAFVNSIRHAIYTFAGDTVADQSNCNAGCIAIWPVVAPPNGVTLSAPWSSFTRTDGSKQLAYKGKPLYTFISDSQPLTATGSGVQGFAIARP